MSQAVIDQQSLIDQMSQKLTNIKSLLDQYRNLSGQIQLLRSEINRIHETYHYLGYDTSKCPICIESQQAP